MPDSATSLARSARGRDYRLTADVRGRLTELIHFPTDPEGWRNVLADPAHASGVSALKPALDPAETE